MKNMSRQTAMIATGAAAVVCGLPGLCLCVFGAVTAFGFMPYTTQINGVSNSGTLPAWYGAVGICLALIGIAIPVAVGFYTLRKKPGQTL